MEDSKERKSNPAIGIALVIIMLAVFGAVWYFSTKLLKKNDKVVEFVEAVEPTLHVQPTTAAIEIIPDDDLFEFVDISEYQNDIDRLMVLIDCEYKGTYDWSAFLHQTQYDEIRYALAARFPHYNNTIDITPAMSEAFDEMKYTILCEAAEYLESRVILNDGDEEVAAPPTLTADELSYPAPLYDCMKDEEGYCASELDVELLRGMILADNPLLSYHEETHSWSITKKNDTDTGYMFYGKEIPLLDPLEQMKGVEKYHFNLSNLRVYEDYAILGLYRGNQYLNLKVQKDGEYYNIINSDALIEVLTYPPV